MKMKMKMLLLVFFFFFVLVATESSTLNPYPGDVYSPTKAMIPRPKPEEAAIFARWLISQSSWGVLATLNSDQTPFGNVLSFSDNNTGIPYFYNSKILDQTGRNAVADPRACFTVTEFVLGYCPGTDLQYPGCAKLTLSGQLMVINKTTEEGRAAEAFLIQRHPQFAGFPKKMNFDVFKLQVHDIYLVNLLTDKRNLTVSQYFDVRL